MIPALVSRSYAARKMEAELSRLTVPKLKEELQKLGLPVKGLKAELVARLAAASRGAASASEPGDAPQPEARLI